MQFPTPSDGIAEQYGLPTVELADDPQNTFIHGKDYAIILPQQFGGQIRPDAGTRMRLYILMPALADGGGRVEYVDADRQKSFEGQLLGYPYPQNVADVYQLWRHLPEPYRTGPDGTSYQWADLRGGGSPILRYDYHATEIMSITGLGERGQAGLITNPSTWTPELMTSIWSSENPTEFDYPYEGFEALLYAVRFERVPYEVMFRTDDSYGGEFSRFMLPQDDPAGRALQIKTGDVVWNTTAGQYGQPAVLPGGLVSATEGAPKLTGDNHVTWKWLDVPLWCYNWNRIQAYFGTVNQLVDGANSTFPAANTTAPFIIWNSEVLLARSAGRMQKPNIAGTPVWDITFSWQASPANDQLGNWNRLLNTNGVFQRYQLAKGMPFYATSDFL